MFRLRAAALPRGAVPTLPAFPRAPPTSTTSAAASTATTAYTRPSRSLVFSASSVPSARVVHVALAPPRRAFSAGTWRGASLPQSALTSQLPEVAAFEAALAAARYAPAAQQLERAGQILAAFPAPGARLDLLLRRARLAQAQGRFNEEADAITQALRMLPDSATASASANASVNASASANAASGGAAAGATAAAADCELLFKSPLALALVSSCNTANSNCKSNNSNNDETAAATASSSVHYGSARTTPLGLIGTPALCPVSSLRLSLLCALVLAMLRAGRPLDALRVLAPQLKLAALAPAAAAEADTGALAAAADADTDADLAPERWFPLATLLDLSGKALSALAVTATSTGAGVGAECGVAESGRGRTGDPLPRLERALVSAAAVAVDAAVTARLSEEWAAWQEQSGARKGDVTTTMNNSNSSATPSAPAAESTAAPTAPAGPAATSTAAAAAADTVTAADGDASKGALPKSKGGFKLTLSSVAKAAPGTPAAPAPTLPPPPTFTQSDKAADGAGAGASAKSEAEAEAEAALAAAAAAAAAITVVPLIPAFTPGSSANASNAAAEAATATVAALSAVTGLPPSLLPDALWRAAAPALAAHGLSPELTAAALRAHAAALAAAVGPARALRAALAVAVADNSSISSNKNDGDDQSQAALLSVLETAAAVVAPPSAASDAAAASGASKCPPVRSPWQVQSVVDSSVAVHSLLGSVKDVLALDSGNKRAAAKAAAERVAALKTAAAASGFGFGAAPSWAAPLDPWLSPLPSSIHHNITDLPSDTDSAALLAEAEAAAAATSVASAAAASLALQWGAAVDAWWRSAALLAKAHVNGAGGLSVTGADASTTNVNAHTKNDTADVSSGGDGIAPGLRCPLLHLAPAGPRVPALALALGSRSVANRALALSLARCVFQDAALPTGPALAPAAAAAAAAASQSQSADGDDNAVVVVSVEQAGSAAAAGELRAHAHYHTAESLVALASLMGQGDPVSAEGLFRGAAREVAKVAKNAQGLDLSLSLSLSHARLLSRLSWNATSRSTETFSLLAAARELAWDAAAAAGLPSAAAASARADAGYLVAVTDKAARDAVAAADEASAARSAAAAAAAAASAAVRATAANIAQPGDVTVDSVVNGGLDDAETEDATWAGYTSSASDDPLPGVDSELDLDLTAQLEAELDAERRHGGRDAGDETSEEDLMRQFNAQQPRQQRGRDGGADEEQERLESELAMQEREHARQLRAHSQEAAGSPLASASASAQGPFGGAYGDGGDSGLDSDMEALRAQMRGAGAGRRGDGGDDENEFAHRHSVHTVVSKDNFSKIQRPRAASDKDKSGDKDKNGGDGGAGKTGAGAGVAVTTTVTTVTKTAVASKTAAAAGKSAGQSHKDSKDAKFNHKTHARGAAASGYNSYNDDGGNARRFATTAAAVGVSASSGSYSSSYSSFATAVNSLSVKARQQLTLQQQQHVQQQQWEHRLRGDNVRLNFSSSASRLLQPPSLPPARWFPGRTVPLAFTVATGHDLVLPPSQGGKVKPLPRPCLNLTRVSNKNDTSCSRVNADADAVASSATARAVLDNSSGDGDGDAPGLVLEPGKVAFVALVTEAISPQTAFVHFYDRPAVLRGVAATDIERFAI